MSEMVWITGSGSVFHSDPDCPVLARIDNPSQSPRESMEGFRPECKHCTGDVRPPEEYSRSIADPGPKIDGAALSPRTGDDNVHLGEVWTRRGFVEIGAPASVADSESFAALEEDVEEPQ